MKNRDDRSIRLLGADGQAKLRGTSVAVVGVGGLGCHVAQLVTYQGAARVVLLDFDVLDETSMNRWVLGGCTDVGRAKVAVAKERLLAIDPQLEVLALHQRIEDACHPREVLDCDYVFGCLDNDLARVLLNETCSAHARPYFDLATDVEQDGRLRYGGRVLFSHEGRGCLVCMGLINTAAAGERAGVAADRDAIYGVPVGALAGGTGPAVVSTNAVVAALAVDAFVAMVAGLHQPHRLVVYRADTGTVTCSKDEPIAGCYYCSALYGTKKT
jgi:hypothetical protein